MDSSLSPSPAAHDLSQDYLPLLPPLQTPPTAAVAEGFLNVLQVVSHAVQKAPAAAGSAAGRDSDASPGAVQLDAAPRSLVWTESSSLTTTGRRLVAIAGPTLWATGECASAGRAGEDRARAPSPGPRKRALLDRASYLESRSPQDKRWQYRTGMPD
jgi:hypothetical protein